MTANRGPLARLDRSRDELAKAWLVRLIERASLDEIRTLPTERLARELPQLIGDLVAMVNSNGRLPLQLSGDQRERAAALALLRGGRDSSPADMARDLAALQAILVRALREELAQSDPERYADAVERLVEACGSIQAAALEELVRTRSRELESQANTDPLTGLYNLRYLQRQITQLLDVHRRYGHPFALLLMDVDGLKRINDAHGHQVGDRVLMQVAMSLRRAIRSVDIPARLGGDEFCVLAPQQDAQGGTQLAERLAGAVREEVAAPDEAPLTLSIGVVGCPEHGDDAETLVDIADRAMYRAKAAGEQVALGERNGGDPVAERAKT
jgi:diguanylate cyclase (GGDEF)-like protein